METTSKASTQAKAEQRISTIASILRLATGLTMVLFALASVLWVSFFGIMLVQGRFEMRSFVSEYMSELLVLWTFDILQFALIFYGLSQMYKLFGNIRNKKVFVKVNVTLLRSLGFVLILWVFITFLEHLLPPPFESQISQSEPDPFMNAYGVDTAFDYLKDIFWIGTVFLMAWVLDIGREIYNESEYTI